MIFDYLSESKELTLGDGTTYFMRVEKPRDGQRENFGKRKYGGVIICHNSGGKLQECSVRKIVDAFRLRKE